MSTATHIRPKRLDDMIEQFRHAQGKAQKTFGVEEKEIREATGRLAECDATRAVLHHQQGCLLLLGEPGTGKSTGAIRWLLQPSATLTNWSSPSWWGGDSWTYRGPSCLLRSARSLSRVSQYDEAAVQTLINPQRLVLDDFGVEFLDKGGFLRSLIDEIIQERHRRELPTVISANLSVPEFVERYGRRVVDRIAESGTPVVCEGKSFRTSKPPTPTLPALLDNDELAAHCRRLEEEQAAQVAETQARHAADEARYQADLAARSRKVIPINENPSAAIARQKAAEPKETADQIAARENEARNEAERRLKEWRARQEQTAVPPTTSAAAGAAT
jgi:hypothetical protein